jgi:tetratricopeptide (TPR) repeat protein
MKQIATISIAFGLIGSLIAAPKSAQDESALRQKTIWTAAYNRMVQQNDIWFDDGDFPRIVGNLRTMFRLFPDDYEVATNLGWLLQSMEAHDEALAVYVAYRKANPTDPDASYPEAWFWYQKLAYAKIPPLLEPTLNLDKRPHPNTFRTLAHSYERLSLLVDSRRVWQALLAFSPNDGAAKRNLERVEGKIRKAGNTR